MGPQTLQNSQILQPAERFSDVTGLCHHSVFGAKSAENGQLRKVRFFVSDVESGARASKFARFLPKTGSARLPRSEFRFLPRKACEFQPAELVAACHRFVTARFLGAKVRKTRPSSRAPSPQGFSRPDSPPRTRLNVRQPAEVVRQPAELVTTDVTAPSGSVFWCKKRSKRSSPKSPFFVSDCKWDAQASKFAGFRWKAGSRRPLCSVFRFRAGKAANSSPPSMSPLVTALSPLSLGPKSAQKACESSSASMGLQILVDPASSHTLVSKPFLKRSRARFLPGPPLMSELHTEVGFLAQPFQLPGAGLVRAWCGPGAGLANPALGTGLQPQSCAGNRIAPSIPAPHTGLPQRPPAAGPRVELAWICFPCTSAACQPLDLSRSHCPASQRRIWEVRQRTYGEDQAVSYG